MNITRGDIFYINSNYPTTGSEQYSGRPAIIVSNNKNNQHSETVEVVYLTTAPKADLPTHTTIRSSTRPSTALCEQISSVSTERLGSFVGHCTDEEMARVDNALAISLDLTFEDDNDTQDVQYVNAQYATGFEYKGETIVPDNNFTLQVLIERDMYKKLYDELLGRIL